MDEAVETAAEALRAGGVVAYPTESFYGLAVRPQDAAAVQRLAQVKQRLGAKPIPLIAASPTAVDAIGPLPAALRALIEAFWPGPLTVAVTPTGSWPPAITGELGTVGVRVPDHELARRLAAAAGGLITATSANRAGQPPPGRPEEIEPAVAAACAVVVDGGRTPGGAPSTVVGLDGDAVVVWRVGAVSRAALREVLGFEPRLGVPR